MPLSRRDFVRTALVGSAALACARTSAAHQPSAHQPSAHQPSSVTLSMVRLTAHVVQITGAGSNVVVLAQPDGLLAVNGGLAQHADPLLKLLHEQFPGQRLQVLFNTDWHRENTGLNEHVAKVGGKIIAHENTRLWLGAEVAVKWQGRVYQPLPKALRPNQSFYTKGELTFGGERVVYGHLGQAHTDGDIYVHLPGANVLVAGDALAVGRYPVMDYTTGGWIVGLVNASRLLLGVANAETRIVPGDGAVQVLAHVQSQHDMLAAVRDRVIKMLKSGLSAAEMIAAAPTKEFDSRWGSPDLFMKNMYPGLWGHARELGGII